MGHKDCGNKRDHKKKCNKKKDCRGDCCKCTVIDKLPFVVTRPGKYSFKKNLVYPDIGAGIEINTSDVSITGCFHKLSLEKAGSATDTTWDPNVGIKVNGPLIGEGRFKNITIKDFTIDTLVTTPNPPGDPVFPLTQSFSTAILVNGADNVHLKNITYSKTTHGVETQNVSGVTIQNSGFVDNYGLNTNSGFAELTGTNIFLQEDSRNILVKDCSMEGQATGSGRLKSFGIYSHLSTKNIRNVTFDRCQFNNSESPIHIAQCNGFSINECNMSSDVVFNNIMQIGSFSSLDDKVEGFICRNTNIWGRTEEALGGEAIEFLQGDGALLQNVNIVFNGSSAASGFGSINVGTGGSFGGGRFRFPNVVFDNVNLQGDSKIGISVTTSDNFTLKNSHISDADIAVWIGAPIFGEENPKTDYITIENNVITGKSSLVAGSVGIKFDSTNGSVAKGNRISSFCTAIELSAATVVPPILGASNTVIEGNTIANNGDNTTTAGESIVDNGVNTLITRFGVNPNPNLFHNNTLGCVGCSANNPVKVNFDEIKKKMRHLL